MLVLKCINCKRFFLWPSFSVLGSFASKSTSAHQEIRRKFHTCARRCRFVSCECSSQPYVFVRLHRSCLQKKQGYFLRQIVGTEGNQRSDKIIYLSTFLPANSGQVSKKANPCSELEFNANEVNLSKNYSEIRNYNAILDWINF